VRARAGEWVRMINYDRGLCCAPAILAATAHEPSRPYGCRCCRLPDAVAWRWSHRRSVPGRRRPRSSRSVEIGATVRSATRGVSCCLSLQLDWTLQSGEGELISQTTLAHSHDEYFRARLPWRLGMVRLDCGTDCRDPSSRRRGARTSARTCARASRPIRAGRAHRDACPGVEHHDR